MDAYADFAFLKSDCGSRDLISAAVFLFQHAWRNAVFLPEETMKGFQRTKAAAFGNFFDGKVAFLK